MERMREEETGSGYEGEQCDREEEERGSGTTPIKQLKYKKYYNKEARTKNVRREGVKSLFSYIIIFP